jgi:hypothetical protein
MSSPRTSAKGRFKQFCVPSGTSAICAQQPIRIPRNVAAPSEPIAVTIDAPSLLPDSPAHRAKIFLAQSAMDDGFAQRSGRRPTVRRMGHIRPLAAIPVRFRCGRTANLDALPGRRRAGPLNASHSEVPIEAGGAAGRNVAASVRCPPESRCERHRIGRQSGEGAVSADNVEPISPTTLRLPRRRRCMSFRLLVTLFLTAIFRLGFARTALDQGLPGGDVSLSSLGRTPCAGPGEARLYRREDN